jgi:hypothetical protein
MGTPTETALCSCGRFSVGKCADCKKPLCGRHGGGNPLFLCAACAQRRRERKRRAEAERIVPDRQRRQEICQRLGEEEDPAEIVKLLATATASGASDRDVSLSAWLRLAASGTLRDPDIEIVRMRFRKRPFGGVDASELWRRDGWKSEDSGERGPHVAEGMRTCWLDTEGSVWLQGRFMNPSGGGQRSAIPSSVAESRWGPYPRAEAEEKFFSASFAVQAGHDVEMTYSVVKLSLPHYRGGNKTHRHRLWKLAGGQPLERADGYQDQVCNFAMIATSAI